MNRRVMVSALVILACSWPVLTIRAEEPEPLMGTWKYHTLAHDTPEEPLPSKEELLRIVPPLRRVPIFNQEQRDLGVAIWWGDYSQILDSKQPPSPVDLRRASTIRTTPGEDEPLVLGLWSIDHTGSVTLKVKESLFPVTIRTVDFSPRYIPTRSSVASVKGGRVVGFATFLPESGENEISPGSNTVFWLNVEVPKATKPGRYEIKFELSLHQLKTMEVSATVEVLPFELPRADIAYGMFFRPTSQVDLRYKKPELMEAYWRDLARHGMTSVSWYAGHMSPDLVDEQCRLRPINDLDSMASIQMLAQQKEAGLIHPDIPILMLGSSLGRLGKHPESAADLQREFKKRGFPEVLSYGWDEPPVSDEARAEFEAMQPARKYMRNVAAINDYAATAYADLIDVWMVIGGRITPALQKLAEEKNAEIWTYDCYIRGHGNSTRARFYTGLYTWALDLKGNFYWCYTENFTWEGDRNSTHTLVLASDSGPVPSVQWEARREGVEDYRLLRLLESCIAAKPHHPKAIEASQWLDEIRGRVDWDLAGGMPKSVYPWDGPEIYPMCPNFKPEELPKIRTRVINFILAISS